MSEDNEKDLAGRGRIHTSGVHAGLKTLFSPSSPNAPEQHSTSLKVERNVSGVHIEGRLTSPIARVPEEVAVCPGITIKGRNIKSLAYTTDVAVISLGGIVSYQTTVILGIPKLIIYL